MGFNSFFIFLILGILGIFLLGFYIGLLVNVYRYIRDVPLYLRRIANALEKDDSDDEFDDL